MARARDRGAGIVPGSALGRADPSLRRLQIQGRSWHRPSDIGLDRTWNSPCPAGFGALQASPAPNDAGFMDVRNPAGNGETEWDCRNGEAWTHVSSSASSRSSVSAWAIRPASVARRESSCLPSAASSSCSRQASGCTPRNVRSIISTSAGVSLPSTRSISRAAAAQHINAWGAAGRAAPKHPLAGWPHRSFPPACERVSRRRARQLQLRLPTIARCHNSPAECAVPQTRAP